jgi:hypothetical protein
MRSRHRESRWASLALVASRTPRWQAEASSLGHGEAGKRTNSSDSMSGGLESLRREIEAHSAQTGLRGRLLARLGR